MNYQETLHDLQRALLPDILFEKNKNGYKVKYEMWHRVAINLSMIIIGMVFAGQMTTDQLNEISKQLEIKCKQ